MESSSKPSCCCSSGSGASSEPRRGFLAQAAAVVCGGIALLAPAAAALVAFLNPMRERSAAGRQVRLTTLDNLPDDGTPRRFPVLADRTDAWNRFPNEPVGAVFVRKTGPREVVAIHVVCPHAGCFVTYEAAKNIFYCPCHQASFDLGGKRLDATSPSPRDLDTLKSEIRGNEVWVHFENYRTGTSQKVVQA